MERHLHSVRQPRIIDVHCSSELAEMMAFAARKQHISDTATWLTMALGSFCAHIESADESDAQELFPRDAQEDSDESYETQIVADEKLFMQYADALSQEQNNDAMRLWNRILLFALEK